MEPIRVDAVLIRTSFKGQLGPGLGVSFGPHNRMSKCSVNVGCFKVRICICYERYANGTHIDEMSMDTVVGTDMYGTN